MDPFDPVCSTSFNLNGTVQNIPVVDLQDVPHDVPFLCFTDPAVSKATGGKEKKQSK